MFLEAIRNKIKVQLNIPFILSYMHIV